MEYNNFRRGRSPPGPPPPPSFVYDDVMRPIPDQRDYDNPYRLPPQMFDGHPGRHYPGGPPMHPMDMPPMHADPHNYVSQPSPHHPYIHDNLNHSSYAPNFNEHYYDGHPPSGPYNAPMGYRDPQVSPQQPNPAYSNQPRSSSPPYKILCITNINQKISDIAVKDALTSDFSRFGDISVSVCHDSGERLAYIYFRNCEDAREARQFKSRTIFFDRPIEIEPIYEPVRGAGSSIDLSPPSSMLPPSGPPVYSPRRKSMSPPIYQQDMVDAMRPRGQRPLLPSGGDVPKSPMIYPQHHGPSPPEYCSGPPVSYPHSGRTPSPMTPVHYERRSHNEVYNYRSPNMASPYSSPTHEQYRSSYRSPSNQSPYSVSSPNLASRERHISSRSPNRESYHATEPRDLAAHHHHSTSRSNLSHHPQGLTARQSYGHSSHRSKPPAQRHHPQEPPARFMSREYRRGKYGSEPHPHEHDDSRPSRVLLVNNIDATKTEKDLREAFEPFGIIEEMEIKNVAPEISSALIKFSSMDGAYKAKTANNGRHIGTLRCRIVYGKVTASRRLWIGGLSPNTTVSSMEDECSRYGDIVSINYTSGRPYCYVEYETANQAQFAAHQLRTTLTPASERKIRIEFVDPDRSEKLAPRHESELSSKTRPTSESVYNHDGSPRSTGVHSGRKRSTSPASDLSLTKRLCPVSAEMPQVTASTFKQERLAAAAAAKARTNSTTSSASQPLSERSDRVQDVNNCESNNKSDSNQHINGGPSECKQISNIQIDHSIQEAPSHEQLIQCSSIKQVVQCCSVSWPGQIALRNFIFPTQIYMCSGRKLNIDKYLSKPVSNGSSGPLLRITQRWRLHPQPKLEEVKRRMQSGNLGMLILTARQDNSILLNRQPISSGAHQVSDGGQHQHNASIIEQNGHLGFESSMTPSLPVKDEPKSSPNNNPGKPDDECPTSSKIAVPTQDGSSQADRTPTGSSAQSRPLRNLISYLEQKDAAGVVSLSAADGTDQSSSGATQESASRLLYAFPPGEFALNLLKRMATNLVSDSSRDEYLLGVIIGGNVEGNKV